MSLSQATREGLLVRQAEANNASAQFDFEREDGLATFWRQATPGTTYWRGYLPMQHLPGQLLAIQRDSLDWEDEEAGEIKLNRQRGEAAIWQFLGDNGRARIALQLQRQGTRTLMEVDDTYLRFAPPMYGKHGSWTKTHAEAMKNGTGYSVEMHRKIVPLMDGIICATDHLASEYEKWNDNIYVCPNSVDPTDWDTERITSDVLRIGYYGSPSHVRDWPLVKKAMKWAQKQPGVEVILIGFRPPGWSGRVLSWEDDLLLGRKALGQIDVGIAPLTRNAWADGKSDVKALEYAMAGVMPILQDAPPYSPWKDIGWEWMCRTEMDWSDTIRQIVQERDHVKALASDAKKYVLEYRTIQGNIDSWRRAISG